MSWRDASFSFSSRLSRATKVQIILYRVIFNKKLSLATSSSLRGYYVFSESIIYLQSSLFDMLSVFVSYLRIRIAVGNYDGHHLVFSLVRDGSVLSGMVSSGESFCIDLFFGSFA